MNLMRRSHASRFAAFLIFAMMLLVSLPMATASGDGLLLDADSFTVQGHLEEGNGTVSFSIDVISFDNASVGFLTMEFLDDSSTVFASDNRSLNLTADQTENHQYTLPDVPVGQYSLTLTLGGEVGVAFDNHTDEISLFVRRLAEANPVVEEPTNWQVVPVDGGTGAATGNGSFRDGDSGYALVEVSNSGEVEWNGSVGFAVGSGNWTWLNMTVSGQDSSIANFTIPTLQESAEIVLQVDLEGTLSNITISVGPPPLARLLLVGSADDSTPSLGDSVEWQFNFSNSGERIWGGFFECTFSGNSLLNQSQSLSIGQSDSVNLTMTARPGVLDCGLTGGERIHSDSSPALSHIYNMDAAHFSTAGSAGLSIEGSNFHVGDLLTGSLIVHNGGDLSGSSRLQLSDTGGSANGESRLFDVGHSLQLTTGLTLSGGSGQRTIQWVVVSEDGLVDANLSGQVEVNVAPPQRVDIALISTEWTARDGLVSELSITLSEGRSRTVHLTVGHSNGDENTTVVSTDVTISPGQRTLSYSLGVPSDADSVWVSIEIDGWTPLFVSQLDATQSTNPPDLRPTVTLGVATPAVPTAGESTTIAYTLENEGVDATTEGRLSLVSSATNEVIWIEDSPSVTGGGSDSGTITIDSWPSGNVVDLQLTWIVNGIEDTAFKSYPSKSTSVVSAFEIPWAALIYGTIGGIVIAAITRFVFAWQDADPADKAEMKEKRRAARATAREQAKSSRTSSAAPATKQEVHCPSCDQMLRVPSDYSGIARCPACRHQFQVYPVELPEQEQADDSTSDEATTDASTTDGATTDRETKDASTTDSSSTSTPKQSSSRKEADSVSSPDSGRQKQAKVTPTPRKRTAKATQTSRSTQVEKARTESVSPSEDLAASSSGDEIRCPTCAQRLKVPIDRRPVMARCPNCKSKFQAEKS